MSLTQLGMKMFEIENFETPVTNSMLNTRLSEHFKFGEFLVSESANRAGIKNYPIKNEELANILFVAKQAELIRNILGNHPVVITSGYRSAKVNKVVGGSLTSAHMFGLAMDFTCPGYGTVTQIVATLRKHMDTLHYDQIILEFGDSGWCHIGWKCIDPNSNLNRGQVLSAEKSHSKQKTIYTAI